MASRDQLKQVASRCSHYNYSTEGQLTSSMGKTISSCMNCSHLKSNKCELNLTDKILSNLDVKLDE